MGKIEYKEVCDLPGNMWKRKIKQDQGTGVCKGVLLFYRLLQEGDI